MKQSQKDIVLSILKRDGQIGRNHAIDTRLSVRLGAIIFNLREQGYDIETVEEKSDTIYRMKPKKVEAYNIVYPDGTKELVSKKIWQ